MDRIHAGGATSRRTTFRLRQEREPDRCAGTEWYSLDCVFYRKEPNLFEPGISPAGIDVIIEHSNGDRVEEGVRKLLTRTRHRVRCGCRCRRSGFERVGE